MKKARKANEVEREFLYESNKIEGVYDDVSLEQAIEAWEFLLGKKELTVGVILKAHKILMLHQNLAPDQKGYFRRCMVYIGHKAGMNWVKIPDAIEKWLYWMNMTADDEMAKKLHIEYEHIHPFVDGNGRTGRMFYNWQRLKSGLPIHVIHEGEEQYSYYQWFK